MDICTLFKCTRSDAFRVFLTVALSATIAHALPADPDNPPTGPGTPPAVAGSSALVDRSLEELMKVEVTSVARKDQQLAQVAAAVYVITADEIRRSGATSVPDALRVVPGIEVAQISSDIWAISARGFNSREANKILVLVDGRSIYNSLYSGTLWDQNEVPLENIERIEVIRGPGATMWGANAVDGVISIITKKAKDTQGFMVSTRIGQSELPDTTVRYGGHEGDNLQYRLDARFAEELPLLTADGSRAGDRWNSGDGGGRIDLRLSDHDTLTADGQIEHGGGDEQVNPVFPLPATLVSVQPFNFSGGYARGRWERKLGKSDFALEVSYTREVRAEWNFHVVLDTIDTDFQHHIRLGRRHDFNWGGGYRFRDDKSVNLLQPPNVHESLLSVFAQDEFTLIPSRLSLTGGIKIQDFVNASGNDVELQPQARLLWTPSKVSTIWTAVSRAVRTPADVERDSHISLPIPGESGIPAEALLIGSPGLPSEVVIAYETGYRHQLGKRVSVDIAGFYNHYTRLIATVNETPYLAFSPGPEIVVPEVYASADGANTHGVELATSWTPRRNWRIRGSYAWESARFEVPASVSLEQQSDAAWATPAHVASLRSYWDATRRWSVDTSLYVASAIVGQTLPGYARVDARIARKFGEAGEFSIGAQNLLDDRHIEFVSQDYVVSSYMRRNIYAKVVWRF